MDSRLRGNDINCIVAVIPAKAGIHTAYPITNAMTRIIAKWNPAEGSSQVMRFRKRANRADCDRIASFR